MEYGVVDRCPPRARAAQPLSSRWSLTCSHQTSQARKPTLSRRGNCTTPAEGMGQALPFLALFCALAGQPLQNLHQLEVERQVVTSEGVVGIERDVPPSVLT
jgi:hypothetical protein